jgi:hypothetical protein
MITVIIKIRIAWSGKKGMPVRILLAYDMERISKRHISPGYL